MKDIFTNPNKQKYFLIAALVLAAGLSGYTLYSHIVHKPQATKIIPIVRTITVGQREAKLSTAYPGEVRGRYESVLAFQVPGKINTRLVNVGDRVTAGQVLLTLDPKDINQSLEASAAQLASARASQRLAADNAARYAALYAQGAVSEAVRDQYNTQLEAANAALRQALAQATISSNQLGYTQLLSDTSGVITSLNGEIGQVVAAGTPIATVVRNGEREVQINVPEGIPVQVGQQAQISFWALPGTQARGYVREIAAMADPVTRTYKVCVAVPDLPTATKLGMTANVELAANNAKADPAMPDAAQATTAFTIPTTALYQVNDKTQVWVVRDGKAVPVDVAVGAYVGNNVTIMRGLASGDKVITAGLSKLTPNQDVQLEQGGES